MVEQDHERPWYKRPIALRWLPAWLIVCLAAGAITCVAFWFGLDGLSGTGLALCLAGGFVATLWILSLVAEKTNRTNATWDLSPPRWLRLPIVAATVGIGVYMWLEAEFRRPAPPANMAPPFFAIWVLYGCAGWFAFRLLCKAWDLVSVLCASGPMQTSKLRTHLFFMCLGVSAVAGSVGGLTLVIFLWPQALQGWRFVIPMAALVGGFAAGLALDLLFLLAAAYLRQRLLAFRLPHFQEQLRCADAAERARAAGVIAQMGRHAASAAMDLLEAVKDESAEVRTEAALALWSSRNDAHVAATLHTLLRDPEARVRIAAACALVHLAAAKPAEVLPVLAEGLMHPEDRFANISADSLYRLGEEAAPAASALRAAVFDRQPPHRAALYALDRIGEAGTSILAEVLTHPEKSFRKAAADLLGKKRGLAAAAVPALQAACADEDKTVRLAAEQALQRIEGS